MLVWSSVLTLVGATQGFAFEFDAMGIVNKAVQYGVGVGGVTDQRMPAGHRKLAGDQGGFATIAIFEDFEQMVAGIGIKGFQSPVIEYEQINLGQALETRSDPPVAARQAEIVE